MTTVIKERSQPISKRQVWNAYKEIRNNGKSAGVDGISLDEFKADKEKLLYKVWNRMASGSYFPPPVREAEIAKKDGSVRRLGIPTICDRVAQMVVKRYLEPKVEPHFHKDSYGYRPQKSAYEALANTRERCWADAWVIDLDIKGFFDNIDHELLLRAVEKHCTEKWVLMYIERWLKAPMQKQDGSIKQRDRGTPQGGVISPLLANMFLHYVFDKWMEQKYPEMKFERYADDIIVHCQTEEEAKQLLDQIRKRVKECKLELHPEKTKIVYCKQTNRQKDYETVSFTFLGYTFQPRMIRTQKGKLKLGFSPAISNAAKKKIYEEIRELNIQNRTNESISKIAEVLNPKLRGWINYFGKFRPSALYRLFDGLNQRLIRWIMKRYKRSKEKARNWLKRIFRQAPELFVHWKSGYRP